MIVVVLVVKEMLSKLKWLEIGWCVFDFWRVRVMVMEIGCFKLYDP